MAWNSLYRPGWPRTHSLRRSGWPGTHKDPPASSFWEQARILTASPTLLWKYYLTLGPGACWPSLAAWERVHLHHHPLIHAHADINTHSHAHTDINTHSHTDIHTHSHAHTDMHRQTHRYTQSCAYTHIHTHTHAGIYTCTRMHTHAQTHTQAESFENWAVNWMGRGSWKGTANAFFVFCFLFLFKDLILERWFSG
jgi:hypothetical protein